MRRLAGKSGRIVWIMEKGGEPFWRAPKRIASPHTYPSGLAPYLAFFWKNGYNKSKHKKGRNIPMKQIGLQLYSIRDVFLKDEASIRDGFR